MKVARSCPTLSDPMDCSSPGSSVHGILQARILQWVAMPSFKGSSQPRDRAQGSSPGLWHRRQILYHLSYQESPRSVQMQILYRLSHQGSLRILEWVAYPFSSGSSRPRNPHSRTLAWKIPWMEEPGELQSMGSLRVGHDRATFISLLHVY